jgi:protein involved in polysaccharide export with SLBB domain
MKHALRLVFCCAVMGGGAPAAEPATGSGASWRERYELGPGDRLNISFYGKPELRRELVTVTPDGCVTYLQANNVKVEGRTIDEAREIIEKDLARFYREPHLMVAPAELRSKRYTILGTVPDRGVYPLDQPVTLLEAIARAGGIETGLFEHRAVELADYSHSFMVRQRKRLPVDFEALFMRGDLAQNVAIEPGDYIFLASSVSNDYYVLGEVVRPGFQGYSNDATVITAIAKREGFTPSAYRERVLVVRGSLQQPETFVVNVNETLKGNAPAFRIQPKDIIFVSRRPWEKAEQILDRAVVTFMESAASAWVSANVPVGIRDRSLPKTDWNQ